MADLQLTITVDGSTGDVRVDGPIHEKILSYGMLEAARDAIKDMHDAAVKGGRIVPAAGPLPALHISKGR